MTRKNEVIERAQELADKPHTLANSRAYWSHLNKVLAEVAQLREEVGSLRNTNAILRDKKHDSAWSRVYWW